MNKPVMGIQLYTLRDFIQNAQDFDSTLERLEKLGVKDVQISAIGDIPAETQRDILNAHGMKVCVTHKSFDRMLDDIDGLIAEHKTIGCDALGLGSCPEKYRADKAAVTEFLNALRPVTEKLALNGMTFNYHNHDFEFKKVGGGDETLMDIFLKETDPERFHFIPDVAWIHFAGADPAEVLRKMAGRVKVVHFKDYVTDENGDIKFVSLGKGRVDLKECYDVIKELGIPYIMYEQDRDWQDGDPFVSTEESWAYMRELDNGTA